MTPSGIVPATFRLVPQCLSQLAYGNVDISNCIVFNYLNVKWFINTLIKELRPKSRSLISLCLLITSYKLGVRLEHFHISSWLNKDTER